MTLENWLTRLGEADKNLPELTDNEEFRDGFWTAFEALREGYKDDIVESSDYIVGTADDLSWHIMAKKLFDWLPIEVVRFFFLEASQGKVN